MKFNSIERPTSPIETRMLRHGSPQSSGDVVIASTPQRVQSVTRDYCKRLRGERMARIMD